MYPRSLVTDQKINTTTTPILFFFNCRIYNEKFSQRFFKFQAILLTMDRESTKIDLFEQINRENFERRNGLIFLKVFAAHVSGCKKSFLWYVPFLRLKKFFWRASASDHHVSKKIHDDGNKIQLYHSIMGNKAASQKYVTGSDTGSGESDCLAIIPGGTSEHPKYINISYLLTTYVCPLHQKNVGSNATIELAIECRDLRDTHVTSTMDPFVVVFLLRGASWIEVARTEIIGEIF
jgi:hypothetical protein